MELTEQLKEIKTQLRLSMNGAVSQSMREKGLVYKLNFGVELPRIKSIAAAYEKDHALAQALWKEDIRECKILAGLLQPVDSFLPEIADIWVENIRNERVENEFLDQAVTAFLSGSYHVRNAALTAIRRFMQHSEENAFQVCRRVEEMKESSSESEQLLYNLVREEVTE